MPFCFQDLVTAAETSSSSRRDSRGPISIDRDLAAEAPEHLRELEPDVAAADDHQMSRDEIDVHHRAVGQIVDLIEPRHGRDTTRARRH